MCSVVRVRSSEAVALRKESVDRNILWNPPSPTTYPSLSARRAWIEITFCLAAGNQVVYVALRKESVDRNQQMAVYKQCITGVALRKESVDRNYGNILATQIKNRSLSARRAWIEMLCRFLRFCSPKVALRKESVDRNAGRAVRDPQTGVALRKESVDRNVAMPAGASSMLCRSPQGERG